ncbi:MAG: EsaB/YukD family protein [Lachnospiraceae bacterium]|nr:EsaB/YukD family protein [Lachnospiraceae bacterium]
MEYTIVTLSFPGMGWKTDMELPTRLRIDLLIQKILYALKKYDENTFSTVDNMDLSWEGTRLNRDLTLADYGIWDGSIIEARA